MEKRIEIDIIIASYAQNDELKETTLNAIDSLIASEDADKIKFNIIVIESEKSLAPYQYPYSRTVYPQEPFGYHRYMNIGIEMTAAPLVCICNNDLIFHPLWATELLKPLLTYADIYSVSPFSTAHHTELGYKINDGLKLGYKVRDQLVGWCIMMKRDLFRLSGKLDENYIFWYADNDFANTLYVLKLHHVLVTSSVVDHLESKTLLNQSTERQEELTEKEIIYYRKKWKHRLGDEWIPMD